MRFIRGWAERNAPPKGSTARRTDETSRGDAWADHRAPRAAVDTERRHTATARRLSVTGVRAGGRPTPNRAGTGASAAPMVLTSPVSRPHHHPVRRARATGRPGARTGAGCSRRDLLRGAAGAMFAAATPAALTGCGLFDRTPEPEPAPDPLAGLLAATVELADEYAAAAASVADLDALLTPIATTHRAHAAELARVTGTELATPTSPADPTATAQGPAASGSATVGPGSATVGPGGTGTPAPDRATVVAALRTAEESARDAAVAACLAATADRAALLGTIAAARACHLEVLR